MKIWFLGRITQVALQTAALEYQPTQFISSSTGDPVIQYYFVGDLRQVRLPRRKPYSAANVGELLDDLTDAFNDTMGRRPDGTLSIQSPEVGGEFLIQAVGGKTEVSYAESRFIDPSQDAATRSASVARTAAGRITRTTPPSNDSTSFVYDGSPIAHGLGVMHARIYDATLNPGAQGGFLMGLTRTAQPSNVNQIVLGVRMTAAGNYNIWEKGVETPTNVQVNLVGPNSNDNDTLEVRQRGRVLEVILYRQGTAAPTTLYQTSQAYGALYPVWYLFGGASLSRLKYSRSPFASLAATAFIEDVEDEDLGDPALGATPRTQSPGQFRLSVEPVDALLWELLGFDTPTLSALSDAYAVTFTSATASGSDIADETLIVAIRDFQLESYDSSLKKRTGILAVMTNPQVASGRLVHEVAAPVFLDLNILTREFTTRRLTFQLLRQDLTEFPVSGQATLVVLLRTASESMV